MNKNQLHKIINLHSYWLVTIKAAMKLTSLSFISLRWKNKFKEVRMKMKINRYMVTTGVNKVLGRKNRKASDKWRVNRLMKIKY